MVDHEKMADWELVNLAKDNPDEFRHIVERYQNRIFRYLKRLSFYPDEDLEDMLQEIFLKVYVGLNDFDGYSKFSSLVYRIAHNHLIDRIRKSSHRLDQNVFTESDVLHMIESDVDLEKETAHKNILEQVNKAISELPIKYREVLILRFIEEKKIEEIVDILRKPQGTIATLVRRGREMLKEKLKDKI